MPFFDLPALDIIYLVTYWSNKWEFSSLMGFPGGSDGKESACNAGDLGSIPGLGRSPGGGHGSPLQYSFLENPHGQRSLADCSPSGHRVRHDWVTNTLPVTLITFWLRWSWLHTILAFRPQLIKTLKDRLQISFTSVYKPAPLVIHAFNTHLFPAHNIASRSQGN